MDDINIIMMDTSKLVPYENNPRNNDDAVEYVANSIKEFGFKVPIIVDSKNVIVAGHTRLKAAQLLGMSQVPCIIADDLTDEQVKAFRLADNKVSEIAEWDYSLLEEELQNISQFTMDDFGFEELDNDIINGILDEEFSDVGRQLDSFSITFVFPKQYETAINSFIKSNGKDKIVSEIIKFVEGENND